MTDHPVIKSIIATGSPTGNKMPVCPVCGAETNDYYKGNDGNIIGCPRCVEIVDAWEDDA